MLSSFSNTVFQNLNFRYKDKPKKVLALIGQRKSGKTLVSNLITDLDSRLQRKAFADPLKALFAEVYGISVDDLYHQQKKETYRQGLQELSWKVKQDKGLFTFAETYFNGITGEDFAVSDDMRLLEELQLLCMFGGVAYKVHAEPNQRRKWGWTYDPVVDEEISEVDLTRLSAATLYCCTGGGFIFNTKDGKDYLLPQLQHILRTHFPSQPTGDVSTTETLKKLISLDL